MGNSFQVAFFCRILFLHLISTPIAGYLVGNGSIIGFRPALFMLVHSSSSSIITISEVQAIYYVFVPMGMSVQCTIILSDVAWFSLIALVRKLLILSYDITFALLHRSLGPWTEAQKLQSWLCRDNTFTLLFTEQERRNFPLIYPRCSQRYLGLFASHAVCCL